MTDTRTDIVSVTVDCHAYPWHVREDWMEDEFPECGPDNLMRMAETYGVLIEFLPDHPWAGWAWWYRIRGPRENVVTLLAAEACGGRPEAEEMVDGVNPTCSAGPTGQFDS